MGDKSKIQWTDATWNPIRGCSRVSEGCMHCYAEQVARRFAGPGHPYEGLVRLGKDGKPKAQWNGTVRVIDEHMSDPLFWSRPRRVFVNSMSDLFHESLDRGQIARVFAVMALAERHTFQVLTKRAGNMNTILNDSAFWEEVVHRAEEMTRIHPSPTNAPKDAGAWAGFDAWADQVVSRKCLRNVLLGVSVEDRFTAGSRVPNLMCTPAAFRWVSYEPALGAVDFDEWLACAHCGYPRHHSFRCSDECTTRIDWIVVGGESGPGARPFDLAWARSTVAACREAGVACFVKQLGTDARDESGYALSLKHSKGGDPSEWPEDLRVRQFPEVPHAS